MRSLSIGAGLVLFDQVTKFAAVKNLHQNQSIAVIPQIFHFTLVYNTGTAFGLFRNQNVMLTAAAVVAIAALAYLYAQGPRFACHRANTLWQYAVLGILSGAVGNLIDRIRLGYVVDFIDLRVWPVFNIADSLITLGVVCLVCLLLLDGRAGVAGGEQTDSRGTDDVS